MTTQAVMATQVAAAPAGERRIEIRLGKRGLGVAAVLGLGLLVWSVALSLMILEDGPLFIADTHVWSRPSPEQLAEVAVGAARHVRRFGLEPKIAFCSQSQFGNQAEGSGKRLREAMETLARISELAGRALNYAHLRFAADTADPAAVEQVVDLDGVFAFVLSDERTGEFFAARR